MVVVVVVSEGEELYRKLRYATSMSLLWQARKLLLLLRLLPGSMIPGSNYGEESGSEERRQLPLLLLCTITLS